MTVRKLDESSYPAPAGFLQSGFWARFKQRFGWTPHFFAVDAAPLLVLSRRLAPGISIAYVPHGPEEATLDAAVRGTPGSPEPGSAAATDTAQPSGTEPAPPSPVAALARAVSDALATRPTFVRFDLPGEAAVTGGTRKTAEAAGGVTGDVLTVGLRRAPVDVQPPSTVLVDVDAPEEEILGAMKSKTRYNVRLAAKKGVTVRDGRVETGGTREVETDDLERWYALYRETAVRDRIAIHSAAYYRALFETAAETDGVDANLLLAEHESEVLAGIIVLVYGTTATYLYGASSNRKRNLMAPYALQWAAMRGARQAGARTYDLFGIPPADDPSHPMHGLYRFKTGFGGRIVHRPGGWDVPVARPAYELYRAAEHMRSWYYKRLRKR